MSEKTLTEKEEMKLLESIDDLIAKNNVENNSEEYDEEMEKLLNKIREYSAEILNNYLHYKVSGTVEKQEIVVPFDDFNKILNVLEAVKLA